MAVGEVKRVAVGIWSLRAYAVLSGIVGLCLLVGGAQLLLLGGSPYYFLAGVAVLISAVLLWRTDFRGALVYVGMLAATLVWALWEAGLDGWALVPRLAAPAIFGLWLLTPWTRRALGRRPISAWWWAGGAAALLVALGLAVHASGPDPMDGPRTAASSPGAAQTEWRAWGNSQGGTRYADVDQLTPENVAGLEVAWQFETRATPRPGGAAGLAFETVPLKIGNTLYACSPHNVIFAIDAVTGKQIWKYDPKTDDRGLAFANCRGVAYHAVPAAPDVPCAARVYTTTIDARLIAIDARNGTPCAGFGNGGTVDLRAGIGRHAKALYYVTSAPIVSGGVLVTGSYALDGQSINEPSGVVRAFDLISGQMVWAFDPANPGSGAPLQPGQTFKPGTPNMWSMASTDEKLGLVYLPMGVATPDFFGGFRSPEVERFSNAIVAVDNKTGKVRWVFQIVHHDLWDYDVAAQPVLTDFRSNGQLRPALITISKTADAFVLDRETGQPLSRVVERRVPQGAVPGDFTAPTQPFSVDMPNFTGPEPTEKRAWGLTPLDQLWCRIAFKKMRYEGRYTPPREDVSIMFPGSGGGVNWGSVSIDEGRRIMIVNSTHMPMHNQLITAEEVVRRGMQKIEIGGPGVSLELFRLGVPQWGAPYGGVVNNPFLSPLRVPCMQPPYGTVSAVNLDTRKVMWSKPIGLADRMGPLGMSSLLPVTMGLPTLGGSLTTRGGLTFIATTPDRRLRAYETVTGRLLWQADLPANANAIPMSYIGADGRQYIVIAAGGSTALAFNDKNILMAFALKKR